MNKYSRKNLNVKRLLELGDLDVRGIAAQKPNITADDYFSKVEEFIENAHELKSMLLNISQLDENVSALKELEAKLGVSQRSVDFSDDAKRQKELESVKNILSEIGYSKLNFEIDSICNSLKIGNLPLAANLAAEVFIKLNLMLDRTRSTYTIKRFKNSQAADNAADGFNNNFSLRDALYYFDHEEANRKLRVLAVDDVTVVLNTITSILNPHYEVFALKSSSLVEKFLTQTTPELFLLDIEMGGVNGFELIPLIRQFKEHKETPIIFLTGNASYNNLKDAIALGACDFITKPVDKNILLEKIAKNIVKKKVY